MFKQLLSVFLESRCPFCDRVASWQDNYNTSQTICQYCFDKLSSHQFKQQDRRSWWGDLPVFAWGSYDGQLKRAIALMKYDNHPDIGIILGEMLAQAWLESNLIKSSKAIVIPIPLHREKLKNRGFNQAEKIARGFCQSTGCSLDNRTLIRVKETQAMFNLSPDERTKNLQGAFKLNKKLPKRPVLLLDDIYTMGTTIKESAKILRRNKVEVIGSIVMAKTRR